MFASNQFHYIPGQKIDQDTPLDRYLPPVHRNVISAWLLENVPTGSWVIDPFGSSPELLFEAASKGYKVLVSINNPVIRFILERRCTLMEESDFQAAIALLASAQVGGERLEPHIKSLYETLCENCARTIQAQAYIWKRGATKPSARIYSCPYCGDSGEHPATPLDIEKASPFAKHGLHRARALERVTPLHDPDRHHVEEALEVYLPRAIYALITMINKLVSIPRDDPHHPLLSALLLLAFDRANTLWPYPKARQRPKQLTIPPQFLEHNIWFALESAAKIWAQNKVEVPVTKWPQEPPHHGGICVYEGRIKELATYLSKIAAAAVITSFPRPNQAFWTLSALWSGWLWGHDALDQFKSVLHRRRYDWSWHITAIQSALNHLVPSLSAGTSFFGLINEVEPGFLSAVILGSQLAKLSFSGIAMRVEDEQAQLIWQVDPTKSQKKHPLLKIEQEIVNKTKSYLRDRGEPCAYPYLHAAGLVGLVSKSTVPPRTTPGDYLSQVSAAFQRELTYRNGYLRYDGSDKSLDVGLWWLRNGVEIDTPLADEIELAFINFLQNNPLSSLREIDAAICKSTPGLCPPNIELIRECLQSYGQKTEPGSDQWSLHSRENPPQRRLDKLEISQSINELGFRLGFQVEISQEDPGTICWLHDQPSREYVFYISESALLGKYISSKIANTTKNHLVIPGSRSNLIAFKLSRNPYAKQYFEQNFIFVKYRLIRQLVDKDNLTIGNLDENLTLDPITFTAPQIRMF